MRFPLPVLLLLLTGIAGCFGGGGAGDDGPKEGDLDVTDTTGGIRGIVVDPSVVPVEGALVTISGGQNKTTGPGGLFNFTGLEPGDYIVTVTKLGYRAFQTTTTVVAGVPDPAILKMLLERLATATPYLDHFKLDGFYECAMAMSFVVDTCDWVPRTAWDQYNETTGEPLPTPRSAMRYYNTQEIDVAADTFTIIQEAFWSDERVPLMWIMLDEYPVQASCDCSDSYGGVEMASPTYMRVERFLPDGSNNTEWHPAGFADASSKGFPAGERVVARGFLPPSEQVGSGSDPNMWYGLAQNLQFTVITTLFHNYAPPEGWTFETRDQHPIG